MSRIIVIQFVTLDGVVSDPDGADGSLAGGWAFRHGPEAVAGDKFRLGSRLEEGVLVFGRSTWTKFAALWPPRDTPFARALNGADKLVVTSDPALDVTAWEGTAPLVLGPEHDLVPSLRSAVPGRDLS